METREYKFRAWKSRAMGVDRTPLLEMVYFDLLELDGNYIVPSGTYIYKEDYDGKGVTQIMQWTGLKDKNGKDIFEGDIVEWKDRGATYADEPPKVRGFIKFDRSGFQVFGAVFGKVPLNTEQGSYLLHDGHPSNHQNEYEVIGNIYENTDLLELLDNK